MHLIWSPAVRVLCTLQALFTEQLKKHDQTLTFIRQNLGAQDNILRALTDTNAKYASVRMASSETIQR